MIEFKNFEVTDAPRLLKYTARPGEVADPWFTGNFTQTWADVEEGCQGLFRYLEERN